MTGLLGCPSREVHVVGHVVPVVLRRVGGWVSQLTIVEICWDKGEMMENVGGNCNSRMFTGWWNLFQTYAVVIRNGGHLWVPCPDPIQAVVAWVQGGSHPPSELPSTFCAFCYTFSIKSKKSMWSMWSTSTNMPLQYYQYMSMSVILVFSWNWKNTIYKVYYIYIYQICMCTLKKS